MQSNKNLKPLVLAINLPQFHPFPENDEWWGRGFTEWTNVTKAKPLFKGHYQPRLPADLGFYDMRLLATLEAQADLAKQYNIDGFCYYHYWFSGKRLMKAPVDTILERRKPDFPFCFFWANETWSRRWEDDDKNVLMAQKYSFEDDRNHAEWCVKAFADPRYIRVEGRPLFLIYKPYDLPDPRKTFEIFEEVCKVHGLPRPFFVASNSHDKERDPYELGYDFAIHFQPRHNLLSEFWIDGFTPKRLIRNILQGFFKPTLKLYSYAEYKKHSIVHKIEYPGFPCINVGFDNTARRGDRAIIIHGQNPKDFRYSLEDAKKDAENLSEGRRIVFLNAWNEWAEGNNLEPCQKFGHSFLQEVKAVFS